MKKQLCLVCGPPGISKMEETIETHSPVKYCSGDNSDYQRENTQNDVILISPYEYFYRHPEAGLGRLCKYICRLLLSSRQVLVEDEQGDIPLLEEIKSSVETRLSHMEPVDFEVCRFLFSTSDSSLCREGLVIDLAREIRRFKVNKESTKNANVAKQLFCEHVAHSFYAKVMFLNAWESSENATRVLTLGEQYGYKVVMKDNNQRKGLNVSSEPNVEKTVLFLKQNEVSHILHMNAVEIENIKKLLPLNGVILLLQESNEKSNSLQHRNILKQLASLFKRDIIHLFLWSALYEQSNLTDIAANFIQSYFEQFCLNFIELPSVGTNKDDSCSSFFRLKSVVSEQHNFQDTESSNIRNKETVCKKDNVEKQVYMNNELPLLSEDWYLEYHGTCIVYFGIFLLEETFSKGSTEETCQDKQFVLYDTLNWNEIGTFMNPACITLLEKERLYQYVSDHPKLLENAEQLLSKQRISVQFPSSSEATCVIEASQMGTFYHVEFAIEENPLVLKHTSCDCPYFIKQKRTSSNRCIFCKHILALMIRVSQILSNEDQSSEPGKQSSEEETASTTNLESYNTDEKMQEAPSKVDNHRIFPEELKTTTEPSPPQTARKLPGFANVGSVSETDNLFIPQKTFQRQKKKTEAKSSFRKKQPNDQYSHVKMHSNVSKRPYTSKRKKRGRQYIDNDEIPKWEGASKQEEENKMIKEEGYEQNESPNKTNLDDYESLLFGDDWDDVSMTNLPKEASASNIFTRSKDTKPSIFSEMKHHEVSKTTESDQTLESILNNTTKPKSSIRRRMDDLMGSDE